MTSALVIALACAGLVMLLLWGDLRDAREAQRQAEDDRDDLAAALRDREQEDARRAASDERVIDDVVQGLEETRERARLRQTAEDVAARLDRLGGAE